MEQSINSYVELKNALIEHSRRTGKPIPALLRDYDRDVLAAYREILEAIKSGDQRHTIGVYVNMLVKMLAAKNGLLT